MEAFAPAPALDFLSVPALESTVTWYEPLFRFPGLSARLFVVDWSGGSFELLVFDLGGLGVLNECGTAEAMLPFNCSCNSSMRLLAGAAPALPDAERGRVEGEPGFSPPPR